MVKCEASPAVDSDDISNGNMANKKQTAVAQDLDEDVDIVAMYSNAYRAWEKEHSMSETECAVVLRILSQFFFWFHAGGFDRAIRDTLHPHMDFKRLCSAGIEMWPKETLLARLSAEGTNSGIRAPFFWTKYQASKRRAISKHGIVSENVHATSFVLYRRWAWIMLPHFPILSKARDSEATAASRGTLAADNPGVKKENLSSTGVYISKKANPRDMMDSAKIKMTPLQVRASVNAGLKSLDRLSSTRSRQVSGKGDGELHPQRRRRRRRNRRAE